MPDRAPSQAQPHVLVADDNDTIRNYLSRLLSKHGYRVTAVVDGEQARGRLAEGDINAVLSDIEMPGLTGIQLLQHVGATVEEPPVVLVTGNPNLDTAAAAVNGRAVAYLQKPVDEQALLKAVARAVRISSLAKERREIGEIVAPQKRQERVHDSDRRTLENALGTMWMAFQPIIDTKSGAVFAYEALLRNENSVLGAPGDFLKAAEAQGRGFDLSRNVRRLVAQQITTVSAEISIFVNLVPRDLLDDDLYAPTSPLTPYAPRVVLEITERDNLDAIDALPERMRQLRALGYRLAVDDLGAGYSGLTSVVALQPEIVKIDMALVRDIQKNDHQRRLVASIAAALQADFKTRLVAEGIETVEEKEALRNMAIDFMQGYFFGKPERKPTPPDPALIKVGSAP